VAARAQQWRAERIDEASPARDSSRAPDCASSTYVAWTLRVAPPVATYFGGAGPSRHTPAPEFTCSGAGVLSVEPTPIARDASGQSRDTALIASHVGVSVTNGLLEHRGTPQPVSHPTQRFAFRDVAGKAHIVSAPPSPYPPTLQRPFLELEPAVTRL